MNRGHRGPGHVRTRDLVVPFRVAEVPLVDDAEFLAGLDHGAPRAQRARPPDRTPQLMTLLSQPRNTSTSRA